MPNPHHIHNIANAPLFDGKRVQFSVIREGRQIEGIGVLRVASRLLSDSWQAHIEATNFSASSAQTRVIYLDQDDFDSIKEANSAAAQFVLTKNFT